MYVQILCFLFLTGLYFKFVFLDENMTPCSSAEFTDVSEERINAICRVEEWATLATAFELGLAGCLLGSLFDTEGSGSTIFRNVGEQPE
jgi:hypothetical protein